MKTLLACAAPLLLLACPNSPSSGGAPTPSSTATSTATISAAAATTSTTASAAGPDAAAAPTTGITVDNLGNIPPWAFEKGRGKPCNATAAAKARMAKIAKAQDDDVTSNKVDPAALEQEIAPDCRNAEFDLATALNDGGWALYKKKSIKEANRYWRVALIVRPSSILPRYNLACGLALDGQKDAAVTEIEELARATKAGDAAAANRLERAKTDDDLISVREEPRFKEALKASVGGLVGPRKESESAAAGVKLLPQDFRKGTFMDQPVTYKPALLDFWTWRPDDSTELLVATVVHDPSTLGQPKGDINADYGGIVVLRRDDDGKYTLLLAHKTGEAPPHVAAGPSHTVAYSFFEPCGDLHGTLSYKDGAVTVKEKKCEDL